MKTIKNPRFLKDDERIDAYLKGEMTKDEEPRFLQELKTNPELKQRAVLMARFVRGMKEVGTQQDEDVKKALSSSSVDDVKKIIQSVSLERETRPIPIRRYTTWVSIAASLIIIVWLGIGFAERQKSITLADEYTNVFAFSGKEASDNYRSLVTDSSETEKKLEELFSNITNKKNIGRTIQELSHLWDLSIQDGYNEYTPYSHEIGGNLALGYLIKGDRKKAKRVLQKIITISPDSEEEKELLKSSKELLNRL